METPKYTNEQAGAKYHFPEVAAYLKEVTVPLIKQLKDAIEKGEYQTLIAEGNHAILSTLVFQKVFSQKLPDARKFKTLFLASGRGRQWDDALDKYIQSQSGSWGKSLVVTEAVDSGSSLIELYKTFKKHSYNDFDFVCTGITAGYPVAWLAHRGHKLFHNDQDVAIKRFDKGIAEPSDDKVRELSGLKKRKIRYKLGRGAGHISFSFGAHPVRLEDYEERPEPSDSKIAKFVGNLDPDYLSSSDAAQRAIIEKARADVEPTKISTQRVKEIRETRRNAREDLKRVADEIIKEVWGNDNPE